MNANGKVVLTYKKQPGNVEAWKLGEACSVAAKDQRCGDAIDRGLILLRELQERGFGVVELAAPPESAQAYVRGYVQGVYDFCPDAEPPPERDEVIAYAKDALAHEASASSPEPPTTVDTQALLALAEKLAAHVRPTCSELWEEAQAILATPPESAQEPDFYRVATDYEEQLIDDAAGLVKYTMRFSKEQMTAIDECATREGLIRPAMIRALVARSLSAENVTASPDVQDDQEWDRQAEALHTETFGPGSGINPNATDISNVFLSDVQQPAAQDEYPDATGWAGPGHARLGDECPMCPANLDPRPKLIAKPSPDSKAFSRLHCELCDAGSYGLHYQVAKPTAQDTAEMHKQTDQTERPMRAGHGEKLASRLGSGGNVRAGESPAASTYLQKYRCGCFLEFARKKDIPRGCPHHMRDRLGAAIAV